MTGRSTIPTVIDSDNALGSANQKFFGGDVDDAFALAFLLKSKLHIHKLLSVDGNAKADICHKNNLEIRRLVDSNVECQQGHAASSSLPTDSTYLALGPLTNLSYYLNQGYMPDCVWLTLGRITTMGNFPPFWPVEFNLTKDFVAARHVLSSPCKKIVVPLDVAYNLKTPANLKVELVKSTVGIYLWSHLQRWRWRSLLLKGRLSFPVWDLVSAVAQVNPEIVTLKKATGYLFANGLFLCDADGNRASYHRREKAILSVEIDLVVDINVEAIWELFFKMLRIP